MCRPSLCLAGMAKREDAWWGDRPGATEPGAGYDVATLTDGKR